MYNCIYVCIYTYICTYSYTYPYACMPFSKFCFAHMHATSNAPSCVHSYDWIYGCILLSTRTHKHTRTHTHRHSHGATSMLTWNNSSRLISTCYWLQTLYMHLAISSHFWPLLPSCCHSPLGGGGSRGIGVLYWFFKREVPYKCVGPFWLLAFVRTLSTYVHAYVHARACMRVRACMHACLCTLYVINTFVHACMRAYMMSTYGVNAYVLDACAA